MHLQDPNATDAQPAPDAPASPTRPGDPSIAPWQAAQQQIAQLALSLARHEQVTVSAAMGRILAEPLHLPAAAASLHASPALPAGTLLRWSHLPLLVAAACPMVNVHARLRAGVVTLTDCPDGGASTELCGPATAALIAALFERMGSQPFSAGCPEPGPRLPQVLEMFANRCELIFVIGELGTEAQRQFNPSGLQPGLPCYQLGSTLVLLLPAQPAAALVRFAAFAVPLIRKLQGRGDELPPTRRVRLAGPPSAAENAAPGMTLAREHLVNGSLILTRCEAGLGLKGLAGASGIAWRPGKSDGGSTEMLDYLPFEQWLQ